jgi:hypothetical protein
MKDLMKEIGYTKPPQQRLVQMVEEALALLEPLLEPKLVFKEIQGQIDLPPFLAGAALQYAGAATLGPKLESKVKSLFDEGKAAEGYILDTAGSIAVTQAGELLWDRIRRDAASKGFLRGMRRTPGCTGIGMETQQWIFEKIADPELGITLTESWMMAPRKSLSFLARFGGRLKAGFSCKGCPLHLGCSLRG